MKSYLPYLRIAFFLVLGITLLVLPATYFDQGESLCLSVQLLATECPGCGMTRAVMHLLHFNFAEAAYHNVLSFVVLPLLIFVVGKWLLQDYRAITKSKPNSEFAA